MGHAAVNLLPPLIPPATWARVSKQAIVLQAHEGPTEPPCQLPAPIRFAQALRTISRPRQSSKRERRVKTVRIGFELQRDAVVDTESHCFNNIDVTPVAASMTSSWSRESHLIQTGRVAMGRSSARATAPSDRSIRQSGDFEPGIDHYPLHQRHPKRQPTACRRSTEVDDFHKPRAESHAQYRL